MGFSQNLEWFDYEDKEPDERRSLLMFSTEDGFSVGWFQGNLFFYESNPTEYVQNPDVKFWSYLPKPRDFPYEV